MGTAVKQPAKIPTAVSTHKEKYEKIKKDNANNLSKVTGYEGVMEEFYQFLMESENNIPHLYLDSKGYPTVGCGHLLGFDWKDFWEEKEVQKLIEKLKKQVKDQNLTQDKRFQNFTYPEHILEFFTLEDEEIATLFNIQAVSFTFLEALDLSFRVSSGEKVSKSKILNLSPGLFAHEQRVFDVYSYKLKLALFFYVRQSVLNRAANNNPFSGTAFYHKEHNNLILDGEFIKKLGYSDIKLKIFQLEDQLKKAISNLKKKNPTAMTSSFSSFPLPAQKALLDLKYNGAHLSSALLESAVQQKWDQLLDPSKYGRNVKTYEDRNAVVKELFEEALKMLKKEKDGNVVEKTLP